MASLWKQPRSKYWFACFTAKDGKRRKVSTKTTDRRQAQKIAEQFEAAYRNEMTAEQVEKIIRQGREDLTGEKPSQISLADFNAGWLENKKAEGVAHSTEQFYLHCTKKFVGWMGKRAGESVTKVRRADVEQFRDYLLESGLAPKTVQHQVKGLRMLFKSAREQFGIENPAEFVRPKVTRRVAAAGRKQAFTPETIRVIINHMTGELRTLTILGAYTGARLADLQNLKWESVDLEKGILMFSTRKTGRSMRVPIAPPLGAHLSALAGERRGPVLPGLAAKRGNTLSGMFTDELRKCGLRTDKEGEVRGHLGLSFHSLRHGLVSLLKDAGAPVSVAMEFAGHDSEQMSQHYTTVGDEAMRKAAAALPDLL